jgi:hypothetical protein
MSGEPFWRRQQSAGLFHKKSVRGYRWKDGSSRQKAKVASEALSSAGEQFCYEKAKWIQFELKGGECGLEPFI